MSAKTPENKIPFFYLYVGETSNLGKKDLDIYMKEPLTDLELSHYSEILKQAKASSLNK